MPRGATLFAVPATAALVLGSPPAAAQLHLDVGGEAGLAKRWLSDRPSSGGPDAGFGPTFELHAHLAILPLLRAGVYVTHDIAPVTGIAAREITSAGVRLKVLSPLLRAHWRAWVFAGFGYAGAYAPGYVGTYGTGSPPVATEVNVAGAGGSYFEVPAGVGLGYRLRRRMELTMELGARIGFAFRGSLYGDDGGRAAFAADGSGGEDRIAKPGDDTFALSLSLGLSFDL